MFSTPPANGALIKEPNYPYVWIIRNGQKCHVLAPQVFSALNVTADDIEMLTWDDINPLPNGPDDDGHLGPVQLPPEVTALGWRTPYLHSYSHDYFQGSQHIESWTRIWPDGTVKGVFRYHNDSLWGFCGGVAVSILDKDNFQIHASTPPSGCISGKSPGGEISRDVSWGDSLEQPVLRNASRLMARAYPTKGQSAFTPEQVAQLFGVVMKAVGGGSSNRFLSFNSGEHSVPSSLANQQKAVQLLQIAIDALSDRQ